MEKCSSVEWHFKSIIICVNVQYAIYYKIKEGRYFRFYNSSHFQYCHVVCWSWRGYLFCRRFDTNSKSSLCRHPSCSAIKYQKNSPFQGKHITPIFIRDGICIKAFLVIFVRSVSIDMNLICWFRAQCL